MCVRQWWVLVRDAQGFSFFSLWHNKPDTWLTDLPYFVHGCGARLPNLRDDVWKICSVLLDVSTIPIMYLLGEFFIFIFIFFNLLDFPLHAFLVSKNEPCAKLPLGDVWGWCVGQKKPAFCLASSECLPLSALFDVEPRLKQFFSSARNSGFTHCFLFFFLLLFFSTPLVFPSVAVDSCLVLPIFRFCQQHFSFLQLPWLLFFCCWFFFHTVASAKIIKHRWSD